MDKCPVKNAGKQKQTGTPIKKSSKKGGGKKVTRQRKKHGPMQAQPGWKPLMM